MMDEPTVDAGRALHARVRATATGRGSPGMSTPPDAQWLPLPEAAVRLGLSVRTLRRRIKAGQIEARRVPTPFGLAWQVRTLAPAREPARPEAREGGENGYGHLRGRTPQGIRGEGSAMTTAYRSLLERAKDLVTENARLSLELAAARAELRLLRERAPAPGSVAGSQQAAPPAAAAARAPRPLGVPPRRPWWRLRQ